MEVRRVGRGRRVRGGDWGGSTSSPHPLSLSSLSYSFRSRPLCFVLGTHSLLSVIQFFSPPLPIGLDRENEVLPCKYLDRDETETETIYNTTGLFPTRVINSDMRLFILHEYQERETRKGRGEERRTKSTPHKSLQSRMRTLHHGVEQDCVQSH